MSYCLRVNGPEAKRTSVMAENRETCTRGGGPGQSRAVRRAALGSLEVLPRAPPAVFPPVRTSVQTPLPQKVLARMRVDENWMGPPSASYSSQAAGPGRSPRPSRKGRAEAPPRRPARCPQQGLRPTSWIASRFTFLKLAKTNLPAGRHKTCT